MSDDVHPRRPPDRGNLEVGFAPVPDNGESGAILSVGRAQRHPLEG